MQIVGKYGRDIRLFMNHNRMSPPSYGGKGFFLNSNATQLSSLDIGVPLVKVANLLRNFKHAE